jgi:hypothetical protein
MPRSATAQSYGHREATTVAHSGRCDRLNHRLELPAPENTVGTKSTTAAHPRNLDLLCMLCSLTIRRRMGFVSCPPRASVMSADRPRGEMPASVLVLPDGSVQALLRRRPADHSRGRTASRPRRSRSRGAFAVPLMTQRQSTLAGPVMGSCASSPPLFRLSNDPRGATTKPQRLRYDS